MLEIKSVHYDGLVYDLMVEDDESFVAQNIVVHNCSMIPLVEGYPVPDFKKGEEWFSEQDGDVQRRMMGNGRYQAWQDGLFEFKQLAKIGIHPIWGPSLMVTPLRDLVEDDE